MRWDSVRLVSGCKTFEGTTTGEEKKKVSPYRGLRYRGKVNGTSSIVFVLTLDGRVEHVEG